VAPNPGPESRIKPKNLREKGRAVAGVRKRNSGKKLRGCASVSVEDETQKAPYKVGGVKGAREEGTVEILGNAF